jgi:hypothetical protein
MHPWLVALKTTTGWAAVVFGFLAAWLWLKSTGQVLYTPEEAKRDHDLVNIFATVEMQSKWNRRAATVTAVSLLCQAISMALPNV